MCLFLILQCCCSDIPQKMDTLLLYLWKCAMRCLLWLFLFNGCPMTRTLRLEIPCVLDEATTEAAPFMIVMKDKWCQLSTGFKVSPISTLSTQEMTDARTASIYKFNLSSFPQLTRVQMVFHFQQRSIQISAACRPCGFCETGLN